MSTAGDKVEDGLNGAETVSAPGQPIVQEPNDGHAGEKSRTRRVFGASHMFDMEATARIAAQVENNGATFRADTVDGLDFLIVPDDRSGALPQFLNLPRKSHTNRLLPHYYLKQHGHVRVEPDGERYAAPRDPSVTLVCYADLARWLSKGGDRVREGTDGGEGGGGGGDEDQNEGGGLGWVPEPVKCMEYFPPGSRPATIGWPATYGLITKAPLSFAPPSVSWNRYRGTKRQLSMTPPPGVSADPLTQRFDDPDKGYKDPALYKRLKPSAMKGENRSGRTARAGAESPPPTRPLYSGGGTGETVGESDGRRRGEDEGRDETGGVLKPEDMPLKDFLDFYGYAIWLSESCSRTVRDRLKKGFGITPATNIDNSDILVIDSTVAKDPIRDRADVMEHVADIGRGVAVEVSWLLLCMERDRAVDPGEHLVRDKAGETAGL